jgi:hypothetical protein
LPVTRDESANHAPSRTRLRPSDGRDATAPRPADTGGPAQVRGRSDGYYGEARAHHGAERREPVADDNCYSASALLLSCYPPVLSALRERNAGEHDDGPNQQMPCGRFAADDDAQDHGDDG